MREPDTSWLEPYRESDREALARANAKRQGHELPSFFLAGTIHGLVFTLSVDLDGQVELLLSMNGRRIGDATCTRFAEKLGIAPAGTLHEFPTKIKGGRFFVLRRGLRQ